MSDNKNFWDDLIADGLDEELLKEIFTPDEKPSPAQPAQTPSAPVPEKVSPDEPPAAQAPPKPAYVRGVSDSAPKIKPQKAEIIAPVPDETNKDAFIDELFAQEQKPITPMPAKNPEPIRPQTSKPMPAQPQNRSEEILREYSPAPKNPEPPVPPANSAASAPVPPAFQPQPRSPQPAPVPQQPIPQAHGGDLPAEDYEIDFDFDREYADAKPDRWEEKAVRRKREKRTGCLGGIMYFFFIIIASAFIATFLWIAATDILALTGEDKEIEITIPKDFDIDEVATILHENDLIKYKFLFKIYANFSNADEKINAGTYILNTNFDYRMLVQGMTYSGGTKVTVEVTIPEGYTLLQIFKLLEEKGVCTAADMWDSAANYDFEYSFLSASTLGNEKRLEGYLFPDTYTFYVNDRPDRVIKKMLNNFNNKFTEEYRERATELGYTMEEILIIASMIEKEAAHDEERATIASVIYNRLSDPSTTNGLLQIDATIHYAIAGTNTPFSTELDSPYNTYKYAGLPPAPIANPGIASIKAALYPEETSYIYYALGTDKEHHFFKYYDSFMDFVNSDAYVGNAA